MAYMNDISPQNDPRNMIQTNVATQRRPEVQTEIERLQESSQQLTKTFMVVMSFVVWVLRYFGIV